MKKDFKRNFLTTLILAGLAVETIGLAHATDLGTVSAAGSNGSPSDYLSAPYQAPSQGSLSSSEPQSTISQHYIQNNISGAASYNDIANISPNVWNVSPNGAGNSDQGWLSIRGFQDGQFNVTFDGIPFSDGDDFTHHVDDYFMSQDTGSEKVIRGPGTPSIMGQATYGGTIEMHSKDPTADIAAIKPYINVGSYNTQLYGLEYDSGVMQNLNDGSLILDVKHYRSDGFLTNNKIHRDNFFFKYIQPINENSALTVVAMFNRTNQHPSIGATAAEIAKYGYNYGLNDNPASQSYWKYNWDHFQTDFEYLGYQAQKGSWSLDNKLYTHAYRHWALNGNNPNGQTIAGTIVLPSDNHSGVYGLTWYRTFGDDLKVIDSIGMNDLKFGIWLDHQNHNAWQNDANLWTGANSAGGFGSNSNSYGANYRSTDNTIQPYAEFVWRPNNDLSIAPGVKLYRFERHMDPQDSGVTGSFSTVNATWNAVLPYLTVHDYLTKHWAVYAQGAAGFLPPAIGSLQQGTPLADLPKADSTQNYQLGTTWKNTKVSLSADVYYIGESNYSTANPCGPGGQLTCFTDVGGAKIRGFETEGTVYVADGLSLYGNMSVQGVNVDNTPNAPYPNNTLGFPSQTAAAAVVYNLWPIYASFTAKEIGSRYSNDFTPNVNGGVISFKPYTVANAAFSYRFGQYGHKHTTLRLTVDNLFDYHGKIMTDGATANSGYALYFVQPGRSFMLSLSRQF